MSDPDETPTPEGPIPDSLRRELEDLGLNPNQARLLLALLRLGPSKIPQLAPVSGVPRTSVYQVLEELHGKGLAERVSGSGPAMWAAPGRDEILDRLHAAEQERLRDRQARIERLRRLLVESFPDAPSINLSHAQVIRGAAQTRRGFERLLNETESELVIFTRAPHSWVVGQLSPAVLGMLERGVRVRVLYQTLDWQAPDSEALRVAAEPYHEAGVEARLADDLPVKLMVGDRRLALVALPDPYAPDDHPTTLWIEHPGYAAIHADAFEQRWAAAHNLPVARGSGAPLTAVEELRAPATKQSPRRSRRRAGEARRSPRLD